MSTIQPSDMLDNKPVWLDDHFAVYETTRGDLPLEPLKLPEAARSLCLECRGSRRIRTIEELPRQHLIFNAGKAIGIDTSCPSCGGSGVQMHLVEFLAIK